MVKILEGKAIVEVPENYLKKTSFYNPLAEISRDLTVLFVDSLDRNNLVACDALAATGIRGIRICKETNKIKEIWFNDYSKEIVEYIKKNVEINGIGNISKIFNEDANVLLSKNKRVFDYIDIDPFGSPIYFLDSLARAAKRNCYVGITATDTQALTGSKEISCLRKYGIFCFKTDMLHEVGIRNIIASIAMNLSKYMFSFKPLISINKSYFYRIFGYLEKGRSKTNKNLEENLGIILFCKNCLNRKFSKEFYENCEICNKKFNYIFPTWIGKTFDENFIKKVLKNLENFKYLKNFKEIKKSLEILSMELNFPSFDLHVLASKYKIRLVSKELIIKNLKDASLVHHSSTSIKTNKNVEELINFIKSLNE